MMPVDFLSRRSTIECDYQLEKEARDEFDGR